MDTLFTEKKQQYVAFLNQEIAFLIELAKGVACEQDSIMKDDTKAIANLLPKRELLLTDLVKVREQRLHLREELKENFSDLWEKDEELYQEHLKLKEVLSQTHQQSFRNNYLMKSKVLFTRDLFKKLQPSTQNATYSASGVKDKKDKVQTLTIINKEV